MNESDLTLLMKEHGIKPTANRIIVAKAWHKKAVPSQ